MVEGSPDELFGLFDPGMVQMLADARADVPSTPLKDARLAAMRSPSPAYEKQKRFIGFLKQI